ncbi:hypothetical protein DPMN_055974 [Dreissena polymorpha]|uniref:Uncharacterized protein n=1 Tax=Dreissena polymorpha TaxID=45954 RepID=A0A9D4CTM4_DREPO|nr:hypothetical protein DPMN_055974 [Dreissena polymorpha]
MKDMDASRGHRTQYADLLTQVSAKTAPHPLHGIQAQRVCRGHCCITCWPTKANPGNLQTRKAGVFFKEDTRHDSLCKSVLDRGRRRGRAKK